MKLDGLAHLFQGLGFGVAEGDNPGQVRRPCAVPAVAGALDDDYVAGHCTLRMIPACLRDAAFGAGRQLLAEPARHGDPPWLDRVLVLPATPPDGGQVPTVILDQVDHLADL